MTSSQRHADALSGAAREAHCAALHALRDGNRQAQDCVSWRLVAPLTRSFPSDYGRFFGENLPARFAQCLPDLKRCELLLVLGTSLQVPDSSGCAFPRV